MGTVEVSELVPWGSTYAVDKTFTAYLEGRYLEKDGEPLKLHVRWDYNDESISVAIGPSHLRDEDEVDDDEWVIVKLDRSAVAPLAKMLAEWHRGVEQP